MSNPIIPEARAAAEKIDGTTFSGTPPERRNQLATIISDAMRERAAQVEELVEAARYFAPDPFETCGSDAADCPECNAVSRLRSALLPWEGKK